MIDKVSETQRISWEQATNLNIYEFLNTLCYRIDTDNHRQALEKKEMDLMKARMKRR